MKSEDGDGTYRLFELVRDRGPSSDLRRRQGSRGAALEDLALALRRLEACETRRSGAKRRFACREALAFAGAWCSAVLLSLVRVDHHRAHRHRHRHRRSRGHAGGRG